MFTRKPTRSWLDRLRSSKGLPAVTNEISLEQFLNQNPNQSQIQPKSTPNSTPPQPPHQPLQQEQEEQKWFSTMSSVLSELFVMEDPNSKVPPVRKKSLRKQKNPKVCILNVENVEKSVAEVEGGEEDEERFDLSGFSRSDLVVIDTSNAGWKAEKVVCRKGDVWRVREMGKGDGWSSVFLKKKKRKKLKPVDEEEYEEESEDERRKRKKRKKLKKKKKMMLMMKKKLGISQFESSPENDDNQLAKKRSHLNLDQTPTKRCKYLRLSGKPAKKSSPLHI